MRMLYEKPIFKSYSSAKILEKLGLLQNQYQPEPTDQTATFYTAPGNNIVNLDGTVGTGWEGDVPTMAGAEAGDFGYWRGLVGFDLSNIAGKTIVSATLRIYQAAIENDPYSNIGNLVVDHVNFGNTLPIHPGGISEGTLTSNIGNISTNADLGWKTLPVKDYVQADLNASRTSSQYRLRFTTDAYASQNTIHLEDAENSRGTGNKPELVVTYH